MIGYLTIGADDLEQATAFYDSVLGTIGWKRFGEYNGYVGYGFDGSDKGQVIWLCRPFNGETARAANGTMVGFSAKTREQVDAFHAAALAAGGSEEGAPGLRPAYGPNWYAAYLRDPTGNKMSIVCRKPNQAPFERDDVRPL